MGGETTIIRLEDLRFAYGEGSFRLDVDHLTVTRGTAVACIGPSGTGKTTLAHLIAGILVPEAGDVFLGETRISALSDPDRRFLRISRIGMVFQAFELLEYLTSLDNVLLPYHVNERLGLTDAVRERGRALATAMGIEHVLARKPRRLSQGERQRVALCRGLITEPEVLICDEPTGNLDPDTARVILDLIFEQVRVRDGTLLMVTHDHSALERFDAVIDMRELLASRAAGDGP